MMTKPIVLYLSNCGYALDVLEHVERRPVAARATIKRWDKRTRSPILDVHELLAKYPSFEDMWQLIQRADGAVFLCSPEQHLSNWPIAFLDILRRDLIAAGRDPNQFPVVFEVLRINYDMPLATEEKLARVLTWPWMDRFDTISGGDVPDNERYHERPVERLLEMIERGPTT